MFLSKFFDDTMSNDLRTALRELGLTKNEVDVYVALTQQGEAPAAAIAKRVGLPRTTTIGILERFQEQALITSHTYRGKLYYWIESPHVLVEHYQQKVALAEQLRGELAGLYRTHSAFPFARVYDTKRSIGRFIEKLLTSATRKSVICTIDTPSAGNYRKIYGDNVERVILKLKREKQLTTHTLVPFGDAQHIDAEKIRLQRITIRELPPGLDFAASVWLIGDVVVHFSGVPPFAVVVRHPQIVHGMRALFQHFWTSSTSERVHT